MSGTADAIADAIAAAVGVELRRGRRAKRWTQRAAAERVRFPLTQQAVAAYEAGTAAMSLTRFVEMCQVLDLAPGEVLVTAIRRAGLGPVRPTLDLRAFVRTTRRELEPLRRWAHTTMRDRATPFLVLDLTVLEAMSRVSGIPPLDLTAALAPALVGRDPLALQALE